MQQDQLGYDVLMCTHNGDHIAHHYTLRNVVYHYANTAALAPALEAPNVILGSRRRPAYDQRPSI